MCSGNGTKKTYTRNVFTLEDEETLIDFVRERACLYNPRDKLYKNITARANCWKEIGEILRKTRKFFFTLLRSTCIILPRYSTNTIEI